MFDSGILDIAIGLIFIYLVLSLIATSMNEGIASALSLRGRFLGKSIRYMLSDEEQGHQNALKKAAGLEATPTASSLEDAFYDHPLIKKMCKGKRKMPSYLSREKFSEVMLRVLEIGEEDDTIAEIEAKLKESLPKDSSVRQILEQYLRKSRNNVVDFRNTLEKWYDDSMNTATEWYKKRIQLILFILGVGIAVVFNADTFRMVQVLSDNPEARAALLAQTNAFIEEQEQELDTTRADSPDLIGQMENSEQFSPEERAALAAIAQARADRQKLVDEEWAVASTSLGLGWGDCPVPLDKPGAVFHAFLRAEFWIYIFQRLLGWLFTAFAITLGAPFWFDLLKKVINIRGAMKNPDEAKPA